MVQCENSAKCPHDWVGFQDVPQTLTDLAQFHYDCIGLKKAPKGKWFCPDCKPEGKGVSRKAQM
jgi:hypothetical protein